MFVWRALPLLCFIGAIVNALVYIGGEPYYPNEPVRDGIIFLIAGVFFLSVAHNQEGGGS